MYTEVSAKVEASKVTGHRVSTSGMLKFLGVSRSGYRSFLNRKVSTTKQRKDSIKKKIQKIYDDSKQNYGAPKIAKKLRDSGETISTRTVGLYMREMGIKAQWVKPWTTTTRDSDFSKELHNILDEQFNPDRPNAVWCTDITYIWTQNGFVYLNCVMDLFARKIIAWTLAETMEVSTVIETIEKAKARRNTDLPLIIHSDRGSQYVSKAWQEATKKMQRSYSHSGYPYDNACIESFHSLIKREWLNRFNITDYRHAYMLVFEYIEAFYNTVRIHSHCDYLSPDEYEKLYERVKSLSVA
ncbi:IS3 family transposase [Pseudobutyrivibrio xylanivorans]|uniref:IS3 family transposase n=1 Tax=Pseudobutyrivibrio xylanivorans TaxID=185007 RepID=A0A5P6VTK2_PSEXY|nr:IS3 family transposase [Pseudobutyrivibrio xylanivorans]QFJ55089.1 IS3 family transposase [Pseudobutyrivibrio xylanivorans]